MSPEKNPRYCEDAADYPFQKASVDMHRRLGECVEVDGVQLSNSLNLRQKPPGTRAFTTGRSHTRSGVERCLFGRVERVAIGPKRDNIITYLNTRRWRDTTLDAMGSILEVGIPRKIPEDISDIYVHEGSYLELSVTSTYLDSC